MQAVPDAAGRQGQRAAALRVLNAPLRGCGDAVVIDGRGGLGKTSLLGDVFEEATRCGFTVRTATAREVEQSLPFAPFRWALGPQAASLFWDDRAVPQHCAIEKVCDRVEQEASINPVVFAIDDLHWADEGTVLAVDQLIRRAPGMAVALVFAIRPAPRSRVLQSMLDTSGVRLLQLQELTEEELLEMVEARLGAKAGPALTRILGGASGNPMYAMELLAALRSGGLLVHVDGSVDGNLSELPLSFRALVEREVACLGEPTAQRLLRLASVLGDTFGVDDLAVVTGATPVDLLRDLDPALTTGFLVSEGQRLAFRHQLVREALYDGIDAPIRAALHGHVYHRLRQAGQPILSLVAHLQHGGSVGDPVAIAGLREAAAEVRAQAPGVAVQLLERALTLAGEAQPGRADTEIELAAALACAGRPTDSISLARRVLADGATGDTEHRAVLALVHALANLASTESSSAAALEELARRPGLAEDLRCRLLCEAAWAWAKLAVSDRAVSPATDGLVLAERLGDRFSEMLALAAMLAANKLQGHFVAADPRLPRLERLLRRPDVARSPAAVELQMWGAAELCKLPGQREEGVARLLAGLEAAEQRQALWLIPAHLHFIGHFAFLSGDWDDAESRLEEAMGLGQRMGTRWFLWEASVDLATMALERRGPADAETWMRQAEDSGWRGSMEGTPVLVARAEFCEAAGDIEPALEWYERAWALGGRAPVLAGPGLARVAYALGWPRRLHGLSENVEAVAANPWDDTAVIRCRGWERNEPELLLSAAARYREQQLTCHLGRTLEEASTLFAAKGSRDRAILALHDAHAVWEECGAERAERRVRQLLRRGGAQLPAGRRRNMGTGWESVTDTERKVVELVAEGLVYREIGERLFISRRTVETHVSHVFDKVGVSSRAELAALYRSHPE